MIQRILLVESKIQSTKQTTCAVFPVGCLFRSNCIKTERKNICRSTRTKRKKIEKWNFSRLRSSRLCHCSLRPCVVVAQFFRVTIWHKSFSLVCRSKWKLFHSLRQSVDTPKYYNRFWQKGNSIKIFVVIFCINFDSFLVHVVSFFASVERWASRLRWVTCFFFVVEANEKENKKFGHISRLFTRHLLRRGGGFAVADE